MDKQRYIIGLGNYSKNDDGIGLRIVEHICDHELDDGFEAIEVGNDGMQVLTYFNDETERILFIDCALMDKAPGEYAVFTPDDVVSQKVTGGISTHEGDILKLIELGKSVDYPIPEIKILAIQPESLEMDMTLSQTLESRFQTYLDAALNEIKA